MSLRMDLHCHSTYSDGTAEPADIVRMARRAGIDVLALTDHDTIAGVQEAVDAGQKQGILVLPAVEMDNESPFELHILGLDIDLKSDALHEAMAQIQLRRVKRNLVIVDKLRSAGMDITDRMEQAVARGTTTRMHIALALRDAGFAQDVTDAFRRYLNVGMPGYYEEQRFTPREVIALLRGAGGIPVLAHPCHIRQNPHQLVAELAALGLGGVEAYYPTSTIGQTQLFISLARQHRLMVTCGSDYHGKNREGAPLGCAWRDVPCLRETANFFLQKHGGHAADL